MTATNKDRPGGGVPADLEGIAGGDDHHLSDHPYRSQAHRYRLHGWKGVIPAGRPNEPKAPIPAGISGFDGRWPTDDEIDRWTEQHADRLIWLRLPEDVIGIDVDAYGDKRGGDTLRQLEAVHGPLPKTWVTTSRDDGVSGVRLYRIPARLHRQPASGEWHDPGEHIEVIHFGWRGAVVWPSTHPATGDLYRLISPDGELVTDRRIPKPTNLTELTEEWVEHLRRECGCFKRFEVRLSSGDPVADALQRWTEALDGGRHDAALRGSMALVAFRYRGWPGAEEALETLHQRFIEKATRPGDGQRTQAAAEAEWQRMIDNAETKATSTEIPQYRPRTEADRFNDTANAERLRQLHGDRLRYVHAWNSWIVWTGTRWQLDPKGVLAMEMAKDVGRDLYRQLAGMPITEANAEFRKKLSSWASQSSGRSRIEAMVALARGLDGMLIDHEALDADPMAFSVANGWIDLTSGTFHPPDPAKLLTLQSPVAYDPEATAPLWERSLEAWLPDPADRDYFQRLCGSAMCGLVRDHYILLIYGPGANGKGTAINAIGYVLGDYFVVPHKSLLVVQRHEQHATVKASLFRRRLAVAAETDARIRLNEAQIKELTGGDRLTARRLYENEWSFTPTHALWLQTNHLPEISGRDRGIWRRVKVLPWVTTFQGQAEDRQLGEKLKAEAPGILNWLLEGVRRWQEVGLGDDTVPPSVVAATADYRQAEDLMLRFLADHGIVISESLTIEANDLTGAWSTWTEENFGRRHRFNEVALELERLGCRKETSRYTDDHGKRRQRTVWHGVGFVSDEDAATAGDPLPGNSLREESHREVYGTEVTSGHHHETKADEQANQALDLLDAWLASDQYQQLHRLSPVDHFLVEHLAYCGRELSPATATVIEDPSPSVCCADCAKKAQVAS